MRVLVADDDHDLIAVLELHLQQWGYDSQSVHDGNEATEVLLGDDGPDLAILDINMPGKTGLEVCEAVRESTLWDQKYLILFTTERKVETLAEGFDAGANDYISKPFSPEELRARLRAGRRILTLQRDLRNRIEELEDALSRVQQLEDLLPICSYCKKIRNDEESWEEVERYISKRSTTQFSHSICPSCMERAIGDQ